MTETRGNDIKTTLLRILHLEDNPNDAELIREQLLSGGINCDIHLVKTQKDFKNSIEKGGFDLILLDYSMPNFDGREAMSLVKETSPDVPAIFVSGTIGEEFAIETLKSGATDYVLKDNLSRLVPSVNRALSEAQLRAERLHVQKELLRERNRAQKYLDVAWVMLLVIDTEGTVTLINKRGCNILGYEQKDIIGKNWFDNFIPGRFREEIKKVFSQLIAGEIDAAEYFENPILNKNGEERIIAWHNVVLEDSDGSIITTLSSGEDITDRKKAEKLILESENRFRLLAENTNDMISRHLADSTYLYVSPACKTLFGYEPEELIDTKAFHLIHPDDVERVIAVTQEAIKTGSSRMGQYRHLTKDSHYIWVETVGKVLKNEITGDIEDIICVVRDITERKQAEGKLEQILDTAIKAKEEWESTFNNVAELIMIIDRDLKIVRCNKSFAVFFGKPPQDLMGKKCYELFGCDNKNIGICKVSMHTGEPPQKRELRTEKGNWLYTSHRPIIDRNGKHRFSIVIATDITELKNFELKLKISEVELRKRIKELEDFYDMAIGRELKMIEQKKEIENLKKELARYKNDTGH